jgi:hypothetical protein
MGEKKNAYIILLEKSEGKSLLGRSGRRGEDVIIMQKIKWNFVQDREQRMDVVKNIIIVLVS